MSFTGQSPVTCPSSAGKDAGEERRAVGGEVGAWRRLCEPAPGRGLPETVILFDPFYLTCYLKVLSVSNLKVQS